MPGKLNLNIPQEIKPLSFVKPKDELVDVPYEPGSDEKKDYMVGFGTSFNEKYTNQERVAKVGTEESKLYQKEQNALAIEKAAAHFTQQKTERMLNALSTASNVSLTEAQADVLAGLMGEDTVANAKLLEDYSKGGESRDEVCVQALNDFFAMDLEGVDFSDDAAIARQADRLEGMLAKYRSVMTLLTDDRSILDRIAAAKVADLPENERQQKAAEYKKSLQNALREKGMSAAKLVSHYALRKSIITDPYYRSHESSEISKEFIQTDPPEKKSLAFKLNMAYGVNDPIIGSDSYKVSHDAPGIADKMDLPMFYFRNAAAGEWNKNGITVAGTKHEAFFRKLKAENEDIMNRLFKHGYHVSGEPEKHISKEQIGRSYGVLANMAAIQEMDESRLSEMFTKLARSPKGDPPSDEEIQSARNDNIEGLKMYKDVLKRQVAYLENKYGKNIAMMDVRNMAAYSQEMARDFCFITDAVGVVNYMNDFPGILDPNDPSDMKLHGKLCNYSLVINQRSMSISNFSNIFPGNGEPNSSYQFYMKGYAQLLYTSSFVSAFGKETGIFNPLMPLETIESINTTPEPVKWNVKADKEFIEGSQEDVKKLNELVESRKRESGMAEREKLGRYNGIIERNEPLIKKAEENLKKYRAALEEEKKKPQTKETKDNIRQLNSRIENVEKLYTSNKKDLEEALANLPKVKEELKKKEDAYRAKYGLDPAKAGDILLEGPDKSDYKKIFSELPPAKEVKIFSSKELMNSLVIQGRKAVITQNTASAKQICNRMEADAVSRGKKGSESYESLKQTLETFSKLGDEKQPDPEAVRSFLNEARQVAQDYISKHTGIRHLFSGRSREGAARVTMARDLIQAADDLSLAVTAYERSVPGREQEGPAFSQNLRSSIQEKVKPVQTKATEPTLDRAVNRLNNDFGLGMKPVKQKVDIQSDLKSKPVEKKIERGGKNTALQKNNGIVK